MPSTFQDLFIGLITSVITGFAVWFWDRFRRTLDLTRKSSFFGIRPGENCLIVMNHNPRGRNLMSHGDVETVVEIVKIIREIDGEVTIASFDKALEPAGSIAEFCVGSPISNQRTGVHIKNFMQEISNNSYSEGEPDSLAILISGEIYRHEQEDQEYAILARIVPNQDSRPIFLISGQSSLGNKAAIHFLAKKYKTILWDKYKYGSFCLLLKVIEPKLYGYKSVELIKDLTDTVLIQEIRQNNYRRSAVQQVVGAANRVFSLRL